MKDIIKLFGLILLIGGCASVPFSFGPEEGGVEKIYAYPYKKVFYAADSALSSAGGQIQCYTKETSEEKGYSYLKGGMPSIKASLLVKKIDDNETAVKIICKDNPPDFYKNYFANLERFLNSDKPATAN